LIATGRQPVAQPILIAGGGIGGLAAALALAKIGRASIILERNAAPSDAGAGIQLGPNAIKVLRQIGVADELQPFVSAPEGLTVRHRSGRVLARTPLGAFAADRYGAPYWVVHRADLHNVLGERARATKGVSIMPGSEVVTVRESADSAVSVTCADGRVVDGAAVIGADGVWSRVRDAISPNNPPSPSGYCAYRALIPTEHAGLLATADVGAWLAPGTHVVHYPVRAGQAVNVVVIVRDGLQTQDWSAPADARDVRGALAGFSGELRGVLAAAPRWQKWMLAAPVVSETWARGRIALVGDAAHPILPFQAQGGAMALEDALQLAASVRASRDDLAAAFAAYSVLRHPRVQRVSAAASRNGRIFHLAGPAAFARDTALRLLPSSTVLTRLDWLYGFEGPSL
jgi:salicylate hydroxylase